MQPMSHMGIYLERVLSKLHFRTLYPSYLLVADVSAMDAACGPEVP